MRCAFVLFDRLTALDFAGVYDPLTRLRSTGIMPEFEWSLCKLRERVTEHGTNPRHDATLELLLARASLARRHENPFQDLSIKGRTEPRVFKLQQPQPWQE